MSVHLIGFTASTGVPLFSRSLGEEEASSIPYSTLAALNGVNLFSRLNGVNLMSTSTKNTKTHWKVFNDSLTLIMIYKCGASGQNMTNDCVIDKTLTHIYDGLILTCGPKEITSTSVEKLKKALKKSYNLIDHFLTMILNEPICHVNLNYNSVNFINTDESMDANLKSLLDAYSNIAITDYSCLIVNNSIIGASKDWWSKLSSSKDAFLLINFINSLPKDFFDDVDCEENSRVKIKEVQLFLPENAPESVTRIVIVNLYLNINIILLVGELPSLEQIKSWSKPINESTTSMIYQHQLKVLNGLQELRGACLLPLDERINHVLMIRHDVNIVFRYGQYLDGNKIKELNSVFNDLLIKKSAVKVVSQEEEEFVKLTHSLVFKTSTADMTLIIAVNRDVKMSIIQSVATKTRSILKDKKSIPNLKF